MKDKALGLAEQIMDWDREDVYHLLDMINELDRLVEQHFPGEQFIDLSLLPSVPIPARCCMRPLSGLGHGRARTVPGR